MIRKFINVLFPQYTLRRKALKLVLRKFGLTSTVVPGYYNTWSQQQREHPPLSLAQDTSRGPLISVIVPAFNTPGLYLDEIIYSIISQSYANWELILVNASTNIKSRTAINTFSARDDRIKVVEVENRGISHNTNRGIQAASGTYIAFSDHDDVLEPFALQEVATKIINDGAELIYSDEDKVSDNGEIYFDPHFKPDWSPDLLTHVNYINHLTVIKKSLIGQVGLLDPAKDGAQDYDLVLRITDLQPKIVHIPKVLYHWRATQNSTAQDFSSKKNITDAGKLALEEHFARLKAEVNVRPKDHQPGFYELGFPDPRSATVIITPFASDALLRLFIELLIESSDFKNVAIELILPRGAEPRKQHKNINVKVLESSKNFLEEASQQAKHPVTVVIQQIILPLKPEWLQKLCGPLKLRHIRAVAPLIVRDGSIIEDSGLVKTATGEYIPLFRDQPAFNNQTFFGNTNWVRNVDLLTGGVTACRSAELQRFFKSQPRHKTIREFSRLNSEGTRYNTLFTEVVLDNFSIRLEPKVETVTYFNPNLIVSGRDYELYTSETAAITILLRMIDQRQNP